MRPLRAGVILSTCALFAPAAAAAQPQPAALQGFSIVLVQGDQQPGNNSDLPRAAQGAIGDMKDFLPFKSYRLVDSAWILTSSPSNALTSRLKGPDGQDYEVVLQASPFANPLEANKQRVVFRLLEPGAGGRDGRAAQRQDELATLRRLYGSMHERYTAALKSAKGKETRDTEVVRAQMLDIEQRLDLSTRMAAADAAAALGVARVQDEQRARVSDERVRLLALEAELAALRERLNPRHPDLLGRERQVDEARARLQQLTVEAEQAERSPFAGRQAARTVQPLIDTAFTMRLGETVVVGTSRVRGDKALIAVLTAVPQSAQVKF